MPSMPGIFAKVPITKRVDDLSQVFLDHLKCDELFETFLQDLENSQHGDYVQVLVDYGIVLPGTKEGSEEYHLRNDWFNENKQGWWPEAGPVKDIHRQGMIEAFRESKMRRLPIDSYWICAGQNPFVVAIGWNDRQVTRIIISPASPEHLPPKRLTQVMDVLVVKREERRLDEITVRRDGEGNLSDLQHNPVQTDELRALDIDFPDGQVTTIMLRTLPYTELAYSPPE